jgi:F0F1-type ATP synthase membrane subunit b/b'
MHLPPDWGTFGLLLVSFLIFWCVFRALFFEPFLKLIGDREQRLRALNEQTERLIKEQQETLDRRESDLAEVRKQALSKRDHERRAAEERVERMLEAARTEAHDALEKVRNEIAAEFAAAERQMGELAHTLASELATRVLERPIAAVDKVASGPNGASARG